MTEREPRGEGEREATPAAEGRTPAVTALQIDQGTLLAIIAGVTARLRGEGPSRREEWRRHSGHRPSGYSSHWERQADGNQPPSRYDSNKSMGGAVRPMVFGVRPGE